MYVCLFFGVALPTHHHSDGADHDDCAFCTMQNHAPVVGAVFSLPTVTDAIVELPCQIAQSAFPAFFPLLTAAHLPLRSWFLKRFVLLADQPETNKVLHV